MGKITGSNNKNHSLSEDSLKKFIQGQIEAQREQKNHPEGTNRARY